MLLGVTVYMSNDAESSLL